MCRTVRPHTPAVKKYKQHGQIQNIDTAIAANETTIRRLFVRHLQEVHDEQHLYRAHEIFYVPNASRCTR